VSTSAASGIFLPNDRLLKCAFVAGSMLRKPCIVPSAARFLEQSGWPSPDAMRCSDEFVEQRVQCKLCRNGIVPISSMGP
jgi:hypothetical protein